MIAQKLRVPLGFVIAAAVLYFAAPTGISMLAGAPIALLGAVFRAFAAGVIRKAEGPDALLDELRRLLPARENE